GFDLVLGLVVDRSGAVGTGLAGVGRRAVARAGFAGAGGGELGEVDAGAGLEGAGLEAGVGLLDLEEVAAVAVDGAGDAGEGLTLLDHVGARATTGCRGRAAAGAGRRVAGRLQRVGAGRRAG